MRDIQLSTPETALPAHTFLLFGDTRTGKTVFGATFPRPLVIADVAESGYSSIKTMDQSTWFEPDVKPIIVGVDSMPDLFNLRPRIQTLITSGRVRSIIFDAFTFYVDFYLGKLFEAAGDKPDGRQVYGALGQHLTAQRIWMHGLGVNVAWNCLAKHPDSDDPKGRPQIPGQSADKFSAGVDFLFHTRVNQVKKDGKVIDTEYQIRTQQYEKYIVGNRLGVLAKELPDPFMGTYADLIRHLGYDPDLLRKTLKQKPVTTSAPQSSATTPVVVRPPVSQPKVVSTAGPTPKK